MNLAKVVYKARMRGFPQILLARVVGEMEGELDG